jgi:hypothetical protein
MYVADVKISLKISETTTPRKPIFSRDVPWVGLFKFCSLGSRILNILQTGSEKLQNAKSSKSPEP